ncbi:MAG: hypothetical protein R3D44_16805 [Hyphomicrobiaceae bacterium]
MTELPSIAPYLERARACMMRALEEKNDPLSAIGEGMNELIAARDRLIAFQRETGSNAEAALDRLNQLISLTFGAEAPLVGVHLDRIEKVRDVLEDDLKSNTF